ncbi:hypothetical protein PVK06_008260 [Gossypium arboreum]|uniref:RNase H type-1 domain-containing protein n=1 Tax=Gossypium arboreum TaxID=29729 RepID=A0ABR0QK90_GOSAR|nr:hypothetical protein PVK06_008260 [Gossypium arboreum]
MKIDFGLATVGETIRDRHRGWILGYNKNLGRFSVFNAELWGILDGLRILKTREYNGVVIKTNNQEAIWVIQELFTKISPFALIRRIQQNLLDNDQWKLEYIKVKLISKLTILLSWLFYKNEDFHLVDEIPLDLIRPLK